MEHFITYATKANTEVANEFIERLEMVGIKTENYRSTEQCNYYKSVWDDEYVPTVIKKTRSRAGAPLKELTYEWVILENVANMGNTIILNDNINSYDPSRLTEVSLMTKDHGFHLSFESVKVKKRFADTLKAL